MKRPVPTKRTSQLVGYVDVLGELVTLIESARRAAARSVNAVMTATYFLVGCALGGKVDSDRDGSGVCRMWSTRANSLADRGVARVAMIELVDVM